MLVCARRIGGYSLSVRRFVVPQVDLCGWGLMNEVDSLEAIEAEFALTFTLFVFSKILATF